MRDRLRNEAIGRAYKETPVTEAFRDLHIGGAMHREAGLHPLAREMAYRNREFFMEITTKSFSVTITAVAEALEPKTKSSELRYSAVISANKMEFKVTINNLSKDFVKNFTDAYYDNIDAADGVVKQLLTNHLKGQGFIHVDFAVPADE